MTDRNSIGALYGYQVHVFYCGDDWCFAAISPHGYTEVYPRVRSFAEDGRAREWIEKRGRLPAVGSRPRKV